MVCKFFGGLTNVRRLQWLSTEPAGDGEKRRRLTGLRGSRCRPVDLGRKLTDPSSIP